MSYLTHLECSQCTTHHDADEVQNVCRACGKPLLARYDLEAVCRTFQKKVLPQRPSYLWRYQELLPVRKPQNIVTLGEGITPLLPVRRLAEQVGLCELWIKDESQMPTGTFKARGLAVAVSRAKELGIKRLAMPSAGNAGAALAAYAARAGMEAFIFMPSDAPEVNKRECIAYGAKLFLVDGLISDAAKVLREKMEGDWFDVSTLKEPYRLEGKKTMGFELVEQLGWRLPDVIVYPTGGGTGLVGMWKAFEEMERLGWISSKRPRMVAVQAEGCAPIVRAFEQGLDYAPEWENAQTIAAGIRVPSAIADFLILKILRASGGTAIAVRDDEILTAIKEIATAEGILPCPEGAATWAALKRLVAAGQVEAGESVVLFNTGSGLKHLTSQKSRVT